MGRLGIALCALATLAPSGCGSQPLNLSPRSPAAGRSGGGGTGTDATGVATANRARERSDDMVSGFVAGSAGEIVGRVVDADGDPAAGTQVHLITQHGERTVTTDKQGQFKTEVAEPTMVVVYGGARVSGSSATTQQIEGTEAVAVHDAEQPATPAKPLSDPALIPPYSDAILDKNAWARAWLLLEVSDTGFVTRVKLLDAPGYDLDAIAVRAAFKLKFEPARDRVGKPMVSQVVWKFEWPPSVWNQGSQYIPPRASELPCRRNASDTWYELNTPYRDCSPPNMAAAITGPWLDRPKK